MAAKKTGARPGSGRVESPAVASAPPPPPAAPAVAPLASSSIAHDRLVFLLLALVGTKVVATLKGGVRYQGILSAATTDSEVNLSLRQAQLINDPQSPLRESLVIQARDLQELEAVDLSLDSRPSERDGFKTDTEVTGLSNDKKEKELQAWGVGNGGGGGGIEDDLGGLSLEDAGRGGSKAGAWDQFAANERLYGTRSDYHEELYTTKLDRTGADYRAREQRAAQLEREILKGVPGTLANNAHIAEERGIVDDSGLNEEDRYSTVIRGTGAYVPPGARKGPLPRFGPGATPSNGNAPSPPPPSISAPPIVVPPTTTSTASTIPTTFSRLPVSTSAASRIPTGHVPPHDPAIISTTAPSLSASVGAGGVGGATNNGNNGNGKSLVGDLRQFVSSERERLTQKKAAAIKAAERQDKDTKLASLLQFSQTFKLKTGTPKDLASIIGDLPTPTGSTSASPATSPQRVIRPLVATTSTTSAVPTTSAPIVVPTVKRVVSPSTSTLIAEIPPFNPARAKAKQAEVAASASVSTVTTPVTSPKPTPATTTTKLTSKINPNAPAFVFRPNASSFTPGASTTSSTTTPKRPVEPVVPSNPFFGTKQIKRGSSSMHVKEDFTPFKTGVVQEPSSIVLNWTFTGKPYRSIYPLPLPLGVGGGPPPPLLPHQQQQQQPNGGGGVGGDEGSMDQQQQQQHQQQHLVAAQMAAAAQVQAMQQHLAAAQAAQQQQGGPGGPGGPPQGGPPYGAYQQFQPGFQRFPPQPPMQFPPPPPPQFRPGPGPGPGQFPPGPPPPPPGGPPTQMYGTPQMQAPPIPGQGGQGQGQPYIRYFPPPPQQGQQQGPQQQGQA